MGNKPFGKGLLQRPGNHRQVFAVIIGSENEGVLVLARLCWLTGAICSSVFHEKRRRKSGND